MNVNRKFAEFRESQTYDTRAAWAFNANQYFRLFKASFTIQIPNFVLDAHTIRWHKNGTDIKMEVSLEKEKYKLEYKT